MFRVALSRIAGQSSGRSFRPVLPFSVFKYPTGEWGRETRNRRQGRLPDRRITDHMSQGPLPMPAAKSLSPRVLIELLALGCIWGGSFAANRLALDEVGVFSVVAFRVAGGMLVLWIYIRARGFVVPRGARIWAAFMVLGLLNNVVPFSLIVWGQRHIDSGLASIINASTAIFGVALAALVFRDEPLTGRRSLGVGLGFCGVVTAIGYGALAQIDITSLAQLAVLGSSLSYACAGAFGRAMLRGVAPQVTAAAMLSCSSLVMVPLALATDGWPPLDYAAPTWAALAYLALMSAALAYLLYYRVLAQAGAGNVTLVTLVVAPIATLLGALQFGEALPPRAYGGFALLALGLAVIDGRLIRLKRADKPAG